MFLSLNICSNFISNAVACAALEWVLGLCLCWPVVGLIIIFGWADQLNVFLMNRSRAKGKSCKKVKAPVPSCVLCCFVCYWCIVCNVRAGLVTIHTRNRCTPGDVFGFVKVCFVLIHNGVLGGIFECCVSFWNFPFSNKQLETVSETIVTFYSARYM